eukprot:gnl/MRDRNA2_/MRDRNA2_78173_c0_seq1.p2 gnl/MRDRNA2_/MRDRNA2_78173_c0~~gnl/MRDRNA2_/MRDRNA2_78173_c0_seq1.p2  ORF type:complete len:264 (+),score=55.70 gnl/MRDRNA2_/MRDRNA2_78173_c0_seq1:762-1553(+)
MLDKEIFRGAWGSVALPVMARRIMLEKSFARGFTAEDIFWCKHDIAATALGLRLIKGKRSTHAAKCSSEVAKDEWFKSGIAPDVDSRDYHMPAPCDDILAAATSRDKKVEAATSRNKKVDTASTHASTTSIQPVSENTRSTRCAKVLARINATHVVRSNSGKSTTAPPKTEVDPEETQLSLQKACLSGDVETASLMRVRGASISEQLPSGQLPLHYSVKKQHFAYVEFLERHGVDINLKDKEVKTVLHVAAANNDDDEAVPSC